MKILLIVPKEVITDGTEMFPSGAMLLIGTMVKNKGHEVKILHMTADNLTIEDLTYQVKEFAPEIVGITVNTYQVRSAKEISKAIKDVSKNIMIVMGGPHLSAMQMESTNVFPHSDVIVFGEGENTFLEIVEGRDFRDIRGINYIGGRNPARSPALDLDYIPLPDLDLVGPISKYTGVHFKKSSPSMFMMGSRGCPFRCVYCNTSVWGNKVRSRKPEHIIEEIKYLHKQHGIREIYFQDDTFNLNRSWAEEIFNLIIKNKLNKDIYYKTPFRANKKLVDLELLSLAKEANFWCLFYGVENGDQGMLDNMEKGLKIDEIKRAFDLTHKVGIKTVASFMIGNIGETKETVNKSIQLMKRIKPYYSGFGIAIPFPGTAFREELIKKNHLRDVSYDDYSSKICVIRTDELSSKEIENLNIKANLLATIYSPGKWISFIERVLKHPVQFSTYLIKRLLNSKNIISNLNRLS
ncbi:MAG: radical SAM protein [Candidatus Scalindua sp.]|nr:radical SAM protein [Candidatus Scalindua sp.]